MTPTFLTVSGYALTLRNFRWPPRSQNPRPGQAFSPSIRPGPHSPGQTDHQPRYSTRLPGPAGAATPGSSGHADDLPGDVARLLSGEEGDHLGDLVGLGQVPERARGYGRPLDLGRDPPGVRGGGLHHVGGNPVGS